MIDGGIYEKDGHLYYGSGREVDRLDSMNWKLDEIQRLRKLNEDLYNDGMIAHLWFAEQFGEVMNGRDFAVNLPMATDELVELRKQAAAREKLLREALEKMLASAHPHPVEHPTMCEAWAFARTVLEPPKEQK